MEAVMTNTHLLQQVKPQSCFTFFDEKSSELKQEVKDFGEVCVSAVSHAMQALEAGDLELAESIVFMDDSINAWHAEIQKKCFDLLASTPPLAHDMRRVGMILQVITDLERMADHAVEIAQMVYFFGTSATVGMRSDPDRIPESLKRMAAVVRRMIEEALKGFVSGNGARIANLGQLDDVVDDGFWQTLTEVGAGLRQKLTPATWAEDEEGEVPVSRTGQPSAASLLGRILAGYALERMADHATNIGEWVQYSRTGRIEKLNQRDMTEIFHRWKMLARLLEDTPNSPVEDSHEEQEEDDDDEVVIACTHVMW